MLRPEMKPVEGGSPSGGTPTKPKPKPEESQPDLPWYYSHIFPPQQESTPEVTSVTPMINLVPPNPPPTAPVQQPQPETSDPSEPGSRRPSYMDPIDDYERQQEQRLGISSAVKDHEQSFSDISQDEVIPDIGETELFQVSDHLCDQYPEVVRAGLKIIKGFDPVEDDEEDVKTYMRNHLRLMGLNDAFGHGDWHTTRLGPTVSHVAAKITDDFFDQVKTSDAAVIAAAAIEDDQILDQAQAAAEAGGFEQPEINLLVQWFLTETFPGEWDPSLTKKKDLQDFLISQLKGTIHGFDETAINWADLTVDESISFYRYQIAQEMEALWKHYEDFPPEYDEIKAAFDRATELLSLAEPIPLDDTEAYAAAFAGRVHIPNAEYERRHVQDQLAVIYKHLNIEMPENYLEGRSTTELKYELYYRLNYDVPQFIGLDENEKENRIGDFLHEYHRVARDTPQRVIDRLQGTFRQPDVLGFLFIMGLTMAFEPVDWALTTVDVVHALSEGDVESAIGNAILGALPGVSSKLDDFVSSVASAAKRGDVAFGIRNWQLDNPKPTNTVSNQLQANSCVAACGVEIFERTTGVRATEEQMLQYMGYDGSYDIPMQQGFEGLEKASEELAANTNAKFIARHMNVYQIADQIDDGNTVVAALGRHAVVVEGVDLQSGIVKVSDPWGLGPGKGIAELGELQLERFTGLQRKGGGYQVIIGIPEIR